MRIFNKKKKIDEINEKKHEKIYINKISPKEKFLIKEIEKSKREATKNTIPLNYVKVDEKVITKVYKIPLNKSLLKGKTVYFKNHNNINQKNYISNTVNNNKIKKRKIFQFKPFSSKEMGYEYYNQKINNEINNDYNPHKLEKNNFIYLKKYRPSDIHSSFKSSTKMDSSDNKELLNIKSRCRSPSNSIKIKGSNFPFYQNFLNNSRIYQNKKKAHNSSRIRHRVINLNRSNDYLNCICNCHNNLSNENDFNRLNKTMNYRNNLNNSKRIDLRKNNNNDNNYSNGNNIYYSVSHSHLLKTPNIKLPRNMSFFSDRNFENPYKFERVEHYRGGIIYNSLERNKSMDGKYEIGTTLSKKIYNDEEEELEEEKEINEENEENEEINENNEEINENNEEIQVIENDEEIHSRKLRRAKNLGDNYSYYERNEVNNHVENGKINHIKHVRRNPINVYGFDDYILKGNKKIYLKSSPFIGKIIRLYRNNDNGNNCRMCFIKEKKRKEFGPVSNVRVNTILLPASFKKGEFDYYYIK